MGFKFCRFCKVAAVMLLTMFALGAGADELRLPMAVYRDKVTAGWLGQMVGVEWGLPTEFRCQGTIVPTAMVPKWKPSMVNGGFNNDDLYLEVTFLKTLVEHGINATSRQAGIDFANSTYGLCAANWVGRNNLRKGICPPDSGHPANNLCADDIDYQIESDFAGLISPGMPNEVIRLGHVFGSLVNQGDGVWAGQFVGAMYAAAFFTDDINAILDAGLKAIPAESQFAGMVRDVRAWHRESPGDWEECWRKIKQKYIDDNNYHLGKIDQPGSDVKPNGAFVVLGLLYGQGDFDRTMRLAMRCGWDSDCNPSTAGGVLATARGMNALTNAFPVALDRSRRFASSPYTFDEVIGHCERLAKASVVANGGRIERDGAGGEILVIRSSQPKPDECRPNWNPEPLTGKRYDQAEMAKIHEAPFRGLGDFIRCRQKAPPVPLGGGWLNPTKDEVGLSLIFLTNAPFNLDDEPLPVKVVGLTNTVVHLAWGKFHTTKPETLINFERCSNVVFKAGVFIHHCKGKVEDLPPLWTAKECNDIRFREVGRCVR